MLSFTDLYRKRIQAEEEGPDGIRSYVKPLRGLALQGFRIAAETRGRFLALRGTYKKRDDPVGAFLYLVGLGGMSSAATRADDKNPERLETRGYGDGGPVIAPGRYSTASSSAPLATPSQGHGTK